jgi:hypothetical protein
MVKSPSQHSHLTISSIAAHSLFDESDRPSSASSFATEAAYYSAISDASPLLVAFPCSDAPSDPATPRPSARPSRRHSTGYDHEAIRAARLGRLRARVRTSSGVLARSVVEAVVRQGSAGIARAA